MCRFGGGGRWRVEFAEGDGIDKLVPLEDDEDDEEDTTGGGSGGGDIGGCWSCSWSWVKSRSKSPAFTSCVPSAGPC